MSQKSASEEGKQAQDIRLSSLTHDEDGVPMKWLRLMSGGPVKGGLSKKVLPLPTVLSHPCLQSSFPVLI